MWMLFAEPQHWLKTQLYALRFRFQIINFDWISMFLWIHTDDWISNLYFTGAPIWSGCLGSKIPFRLLIFKTPNAKNIYTIIRKLQRKYHLIIIPKCIETLSKCISGSVFSKLFWVGTIFEQNGNAQNNFWKRRTEKQQNIIKNCSGQEHFNV